MILKYHLSTNKERNYNIIILMKTYKFKLKDGTVKTMEFDELVRWACLIEALDVVSSKEGMDIESDNPRGVLKPRTGA